MRADFALYYADGHNSCRIPADGCTCTMQEQMTESDFSVISSPLVDVDWVLERLDRPDVQVIDTRSVQAYMRGHIPGAINLPAVYLTDPTGDPPKPSFFARMLGSAGVRPDDAVVGVDEGASAGAARLFWVLHYYGHGHAYLLDGGMTAWGAAGLPQSTGPVKPVPSVHDLSTPRYDVIAHRDDIELARQRADAVIVDVRSESEYRGMEAHAARPGHIPGAMHIEWIENLVLDPERGPRWRNQDAIRALYEKAGVDEEKELFLYCQSGGRAAASYFAAKLAGLSRVRVYARGWGEWGNAPDSEVAR